MHSFQLTHRNVWFFGLLVESKTQQKYYSLQVCLVLRFCIRRICRQSYLCYYLDLTAASKFWVIYQQKWMHSVTWKKSIALNIVQRRFCLNWKSLSYVCNCFQHLIRKYDNCNLTKLGFSFSPGKIYQSSSYIYISHYHRASSYNNFPWFSSKNRNWQLTLNRISDLSHCNGSQSDSKHPA